MEGVTILSYEGRLCSWNQENGRKYPIEIGTAEISNMKQ